jgi:hypothetical protein
MRLSCTLLEGQHLASMKRAITPNPACEKACLSLLSLVRFKALLQGSGAQEKRSF